MKSKNDREGTFIDRQSTQVVNLISRCASIIFMDIFTDIHIHSKPGNGHKTLSAKMV